MSARERVTIDESDAVQLDLQSALLLYRSKHGHVYCTAHEIFDHPVISGGGKIIGAGQPATKEALAKFVEAIAEATAFRGIVPDNLVYTAPNIIAWWLPSTKRRVWFKSPEKEIGTASADVLHPALLFVAASQRWFVFALKESARPTEKTEIFKAPYFNIWDNGEICTGNVNLPDAPTPAAIAKYEAAFFRSRFTHTNDDELARYPGGAIALWRDQLRDPAAPLVAGDVLISRKETFEQLMKKIQKEKAR